MALRRWMVSVGLLLAACGDSDAGSGGQGGGATGGSPTGPGGSPGVGGGITPPPPACDAADPPGDTTVSEPELIAELSDSWHEAWLASPGVADLDQDGIPEIVVARAERLLVWHADGTLVWSAELKGRAWSSPVVGDLRPEIAGLEVAQASADKIYLFDANGESLSGFPYTFTGELRSLAAGDIDGDGDLELVTATTQYLEEGGKIDTVLALHADGQVVAGFPPHTSGSSGCDDACYVYNSYDQNVAIGDVDADGVGDIFVTQDNAYNALHKGTGEVFDCAPSFANKTKFLGVRGLHVLAEAEAGYAEDEATALQAHHTNTAPAIADLDGDGMRELVYVASVQNAAQDDRFQGVALWALKNDGTRPAAWTTPLHFPNYLSGLWDYGETNIVAITNQVTVADLDPDRAGPELIFAGFDGVIHAVDAQQTILWEVAYTNREDVATGGLVVADLSGDGSPEIVFSTYSTSVGASELFILDAGGNLLHRVALPGRGAMPVPTIADTDGDGTLDIVVSLKDSEDGAPQVLLYRIGSASSNCVLWPTGRGNWLRNGLIP